MDSDDNIPVFSGLRQTHDIAIEESGLFGTHRRWTNINRYEIIFLIIGVLAAVATDGLTIYRLTQTITVSEPDFVYGILILANSIFLLLFLMTGIFQQRITDIVSFFISAVLLTVYVVAHYIIRHKESGSEEQTDDIIRLVRLICTCVFNVLFIPLSIIVIRDYERDEFSKRLFGAFPAARWPLKIYNIFDCTARVNTMLSISTLLLNLYNFNVFEPIDRVFLAAGIPLAFLWLGVGIGMVRLESRRLVFFFGLLSLFQPAFLGYCLYSAIDYSPTEPTTSAILSTTTTTSIFPSTTTITSTSSAVTTLTTTTTFASTTAKPLIRVITALYVCIAINVFTYILSLFMASLCIRNFHKGLKEKVFNNRADKWLQRRWFK